MIVWQESAPLKMPLGEKCWLPQSGRHAEKYSLLTSKKLPFVLRERSQFQVAHPRFDVRENFAEDNILHFSGLFDQSDLFPALDSFDAIDEIRFVRELGSAKHLAFKAGNKTVRHSLRGNETNFAISSPA